MRWSRSCTSSCSAAGVALAAGLLALAGARRGAAEPTPLYRQLCAPCHGDAGDGRGDAAPYLTPRPRDFTREPIKFRSTAPGTLPTDGDLARTIRAGVPGTSMPAWGDALSAGEVDELVGVVKAFSPRFARRRAGTPIAVPSPPAFDAALAARGRPIWERLACGECHGQRGRGDGPAVPTLRDAAGRPIRPADFTTGVYKGGARPEDVYRTFMTGLDGTPMPSFADVVPAEDDRWALVAYVLSLGRERTVLDWLADDPIVSRSP